MSSDLNKLEIEDINKVKEARFQLWHMGILQWKFSITQKKIWDFYNSTNEKTIVLNCSRRLGKTYLLTLMAIEQCLKHERSIVKFLMPENKMIRTTLRPIMQEIFQDAPKELTPHFNTQDSIYKFANGSEIHLAGTDNGNYLKIRGGNCHLAIVDEAGFCTDLDHIIKFILIPTTTLTRGRIILSSTTPPDPDHEFIKAMEDADLKGTLIRKTIFDARDDDMGSESPRITDEIIGDIIKSYPTGEEDEAFRTEYLCQIIFNSNDSVIPEFTKEVQANTITEHWKRPVFYDGYVSMDIGFVDLTVVLFGYWDFENGVLVVEDEIVINGPELTTRKLAELILRKETGLWTDTLTGEFKSPYKRVSDNNLILINDLQKDFNITFFATEKHNKDSYMGMLRNMIGANQIVINPRCKTLISHLKLATWDNKKAGARDFKRSTSGDVPHHFDAVAALMYMVRNIDMNKNPYPKGYKYSKMAKTHGIDNVFDNPYKAKNTEGMAIFGKLIPSKNK